MKKTKLPKKVLCWKCCTMSPYTVKERQKISDLGSYERLFEVPEKYGVCNICGEEIYVPGLLDINQAKEIEILNEYYESKKERT